MINFVAASPEVQRQRDEDYALMGPHAAACLAEALDYMMDASRHGRSAASGLDVSTEWYELETLIGATRQPQDWAWPPAALRAQVRRDTVRTGDTPGDSYHVVLEWLTTRPDVADPGYSRAYVLDMPLDMATHRPKLKVCYQASPVLVETRQTVPAESNPEADFYDWQPVTEYDADKLFDEFSTLADAAVHQAPDAWDLSRFSNERPLPLPRITRLPQRLLADVLEQF